VIEPRGASLVVVRPDARLRVLRYGASERAVVVLPGITTTALASEFLAESLANSFTVFAADLRGRGNSDRVPDGSHRIDDYRDDLEGLITSLELSRPIILGLSLGARIAAAFATRNPEGYDRLILVDPPLTGPGRDPYPTSLAEFLTQLHEADQPDAVARMRNRYPHWPEREIRIRCQELRTCDPTAIIESYRNFHDEDFHADYRLLDRRASLLHGANSRVVTQDGVAELRLLNPLVSTLAVPSSGHLVPWDNPAKFLTILLIHLRKVY
jgi:N-formylmaleamate deformylase